MTDSSEINATPVNYSLSSDIFNCASGFGNCWLIRDLPGGVDAIKKEISEDFLTGKTAEDMEVENFDVFVSQASGRKMYKASSYIGLSYLSQAENALKINDSDKCSHMLGKANYYLGYLSCAEKFLELEFSKKVDGRKKGGNATKKLLQKGRDEVIKLLKKNRPADGWNSYTQAAEKIMDEFNSYVLKYGDPTRSGDKFELLKGWMSNKKNNIPVFPDVYMAFWDNANKDKIKRREINSRG